MEEGWARVSTLFCSEKQNQRKNVGEILAYKDGLSTTFSC